MQDLATIAETSAAPTPSLPPRVAALARLISVADHGMGDLRYHLPTGFRPLTDEERAEARRSLSTYEQMLDPRAEFAGYSASDARLGIVTKLLQGTAASTASESAIEAKFDLFEMALNDVPAWAVAKAVLRWARREVPESVESKPNYNFSPSPQTIRGLAQLELLYVRSAAAVCRKVLAAVSIEEALNPRRPDRTISRDEPIPALRKM